MHRLLCLRLTSNLAVYGPVSGDTLPCPHCCLPPCPLRVRVHGNDQWEAPLSYFPQPRDSCNALTPSPPIWVSKHTQTLLNTMEFVGTHMSTYIQRHIPHCSSSQSCCDTASKLMVFLLQCPRLPLNIHHYHPWQAVATGLQSNPIP